MGTQALTFLRFSKRTERSTARSRTTGNLRERREGDGLVFVGAGELVYERGAGHHGLAVDEHGAGAADLFEAVGVVGDGRGGLAGDVDGVERDLAEERGDVHVRAIGDLELLGGGGGVRVGLALDLDFDGAWHGLLPSLFCASLRSAQNKIIRSSLLSGLKPGPISETSAKASAEADPSLRSRMTMWGSDNVVARNAVRYR